MQLKAHPQELRFVENPDKNGAQRFTSFLQNQKKRIKTLFWRSHPIANFLWKKVFLIFVRKCVGWSRTKTSRAKILLRYVLNCRRMVPNIPWQVTVNRIDTNNERLLSETTPMLSTVRLNPHNLFSFQNVAGGKTTDTARPRLAFSSTVQAKTLIVEQRTKE